MKYLQWLRTQFGRTPSNTSPSTSPDTLVKLTLMRQTDVLLQQQRHSALEKIRKSWHWGNTGHLELQAVEQCEALLTWQGHDETVTQYVERILPALAQLAAQWAADVGDVDGYGAGTVREIEQSMMVKARCCRLIP